MKTIITAVILFLISALAFVMSFRSFREKGFLFNNAYIYASAQERAVMNKKPHYRQSGIVFLLIGFIFLLNGITILFNVGWLSYIMAAVVIITLIYAIASGIIIERQTKKR